MLFDKSLQGLLQKSQGRVRSQSIEEMHWDTCRVTWGKNLIFSDYYVLQCSLQSKPIVLFSIIEEKISRYQAGNAKGIDRGNFERPSRVVFSVWVLLQGFSKLRPKFIKIDDKLPYLNLG